MGVYSLNRTILGGIDESTIVADESYVGAAGCYQAMIDMELNKHAIFEATIQRDFLEASYIHEGYDTEALNEASIGGIFDKIKAFLKKVWEKLKGIFQSFIKRLDTVIIRDNKEFVKKYQKEVYKKNLSKMKYKWCDPTGKLSDLKDKISGDDIQMYAHIIIDIVSEKSQAYDKEYKKIKENIENGDLEDDVLEAVVPELKTDYKELEKDFHDYCYDDEESEEGLSGSRLAGIVQDLMGDKTKKEVEKAQKDTNKLFANIIKDLDKASSAVLKDKDLKDKNSTSYSTQQTDYYKYQHTNANSNTINRRHHSTASVTGYTGKELVEEYVKRAGIANQAIGIVEAVHNKLVAAFLREHKFGITQSRKVFAKAVTYNPKKANNEAMELYLDAVAEAAEFDMDLIFESTAI